MDKIGVIKEIDKLGRIVVPMDLRRRYGLEDHVEPVATKDGILIKNSGYILVRKNVKK